MNVIVLFSGAKDSTFAVYKAMLQGMNVLRLVTIIPRGEETSMFHHPNLDFVGMQAEAMGIPLLTREVPEGDDEEAVLKEAIGSVEGIEGVVTGTLFSNEQKIKLDSLCDELGKEHISISWDRSMGQYWQEMLVSGFDVIVTSVNAQGMGEEWLGRKIDEQAIRELHKLKDKFEVHPGGEFGEFETFVRDGPVFSKKVEIMDSEKNWNGVKGVFRIRDAKLEDK